MDDGSILALAVMVALIALSGFFSAVETAFSSLNEIRLKSRAEDGDAAAARVLAMAQQHDKLFSTILVGDTIANLAAASLGVLLLIRPLGALRGTIVSAVVLAVVILLFGEIGPRSMAREIPEKVATASVPAMRFFIPLLTPLTGLFGLWNKLVTHCFHSKAEPDSITEGELITMVSEAESEGELTDREGELIRSAIEFDDVEVGEILTPRVDVVAVKDTVSFDELAEVFAETGYSRLPVYHGTIDDIVGVVHEKDFSKARMRGLTSLHALVTPALFTTGATKISSMLRTFREEHHHMAVRSTTTWRWWWTSTAAPRASSPWRTSWKSWWARSGTSTTRPSRTSAPRRTAAGWWPAPPAWTICTKSWTSRRRRPTPTPSTACCRT